MIRRRSKMITGGADIAWGEDMRMEMGTVSGCAFADLERIAEATGGRSFFPFKILQAGHTVVHSFIGPTSFLYKHCHVTVLYTEGAP